MTDHSDALEISAQQRALAEQLLSLLGNDQHGDTLIIVDERKSLPAPVESCIQSLEASGIKIETRSARSLANDLDSLGDQRWAQVCVIDPQVEIDVLTSLLARLRDLHTARLVHVDRCTQWSFSASLALGFSKIPAERFADSENGGFKAFEFEIRNYKQIPDWLNAKNWANPELWGKHSW